VGGELQRGDTEQVDGAGELRDRDHGVGDGLEAEVAGQARYRGRDLRGVQLVRRLRGRERVDRLVEDVQLVVRSAAGRDDERPGRALVAPEHDDAGPAGAGRFDVHVRGQVDRVVALGVKVDV